MFSENLCKLLSAELYIMYRNNKDVNAMLLWQHSNLQCDYYGEVKYSYSANQQIILTVKMGAFNFLKTILTKSDQY